MSYFYGGGAALDVNNTILAPQTFTNFNDQNFWLPIHANAVNIIMTLNSTGTVDFTTPGPQEAINTFQDAASLRFRGRLFPDPSTKDIFFSCHFTNYVHGGTPAVASQAGFGFMFEGELLMATLVGMQSNSAFPSASFYKLNPASVSTGAINLVNTTNFGAVPANFDLRVRLGWFLGANRKWLIRQFEWQRDGLGYNTVVQTVEYALGWNVSFFGESLNIGMFMKTRESGLAARLTQFDLLEGYMALAS